MNISTTPAVYSCPCSFPPPLPPVTRPPPPPRKPFISFLKCNHIVCIFYLLPFSTIILRFFSVGVWTNSHSSLLFSMAQYGYATMHILIHLDGHLHCFQCLAITNECAMSFHINYLYVHYAFSSLGSISRNGMVGSYNRLVLWNIYVLRNCETVSQNGCNILQSHHQYMRIPVSLHFQHLAFLIFDIPVGMKWYLIVISNCISLVSNDVEHLFVYLSVIHTCSFVKFLFNQAEQIFF